MDFYPLKTGELPPDEPDIPVGAIIVFEEGDAEVLLDLCNFLVEYQMQHEAKGEEVDLPSIFYQDNIQNIATIIKIIDHFPEHERLLPHEFEVEFLDDMRPIFEHYWKKLSAEKETAVLSQQWDKDHPIYECYEVWHDAKKEFFPDVSQMN